MRFFLTSILLIGALCLPKAYGESSAKLKKELASQRFSGVLEGKVRFTILGQLRCGANSLQAIFYEWEESSPAGAAVHSSYRVILMQGLIYLGSYAVADKPSIQGDELKFPYSENGNSIKCTDGVPPMEVLLDGEDISLAK
jgi:hypothetical protein